MLNFLNHYVSQQKYHEETCLERACLNIALAIKNSLFEIEKSILYWRNFQEKLQTKKAFLFLYLLCLKHLFTGFRRTLTLWFTNTPFFIENPCYLLPPLILKTNQVQSQNPSSSTDLHLYFNLGFSFISLYETF